MANRDFKDLQHASREVKVISGIIKIVGAASAANNVVTLDKGGDMCASVARTGTGLITLTLQDPYVELHGASVSIQTPDARAARVHSNDVVSAKTIVFKTVDDALAAADTPNGSTDYLHFALFLKNASIR